MCWGHFRSKWQKLSSNWLTHNRESLVYVIGNPKVFLLQAQLDPGLCLQDLVSLCSSGLCFSSACHVRQLLCAQGKPQACITAS